MVGQIGKGHIQKASGWRGASLICLGSGYQNCNAETRTKAGTQETHGRRRAQIVRRQLAGAGQVWKTTACRSSPNGEEGVV